MSSGEDFNRVQTHFQSQPQNTNPETTPIRVTGVHPIWQPDLSSGFQPQDGPIHLNYNQSYQNLQHFQQPNYMPPYMNGPYYHQPTAPIQYPTTQPHNATYGSQGSTTRPTPVVSNKRGHKNWSKEEDLQLTIAWCRIMTNPAVGVGQKKGTLWGRVVELFSNLMHENPSEGSRSVDACDSRMTDIKAHCSRWTATRARALSTCKSGWSQEDIENFCYTLYEAEGKGPFKWKECWEILKDNPKWQDYNNKPKTGMNSSQSTKGKQAKMTPTPVEPHLDESITNATSDVTKTQPANTPAHESTFSEPIVDGMGMCTPNLDGPASNDIDRPIGMKRSKANNQRQRRKIKHSESQASASQSLTAGLMNLTSTTTSNWDNLRDDNQKRDAKDEERYNDMKRKMDVEHELKVLKKGMIMVKERTTLVQQKVGIGEQQK